MKQKILSLSLATMLVGSVGVQAYGAPSDQVSNETAQNKAKYTELSNQVLTLNSQVSSLNAQIENLQQITNDNDLKMKDINNQIAVTNKEISAVKNEIEQKQQKLGVRMSAMYKSQLNFNPVVFLLTSNNFGEFLSRLNAFSRIISLDNNLIDSLRESKQALDNDMASLNQKENDLKTLQESTNKSINELNQKKQEQEASIAKLNAQKDQVLTTIEANENELISYSVNIINSANPSLTQLEEAKTNLTNLLPQLSIESVKEKANQAINNANGSINAIKKQQEAEAKAQQEAAAKAQQEAAANAEKNNASTNSITNSTNNSSTNSSSSNSSSNSTSSNNISNESNSNSSNPTVNYKKMLHVEATAYTGGTLTAMGLKPVRDPNGISTIAVDPTVIPLGSKVYIPGYGYAIASDTGGAIKGNIIDLYLNSEQACNSWGRRNITIYIVAYPGQW
ncbi:MAG: 3D domain-containing protein [Sarcina sp.]